MIGRFFRSINPVMWYLDYARERDLRLERQREFERMERSDEREMFRQTMQNMSTMVERAFESNKAQNEAFNTFLDAFKTTDRPKVREYDEDEEVKRYMERRGGTPPELAGLDKLEQFERLIDKLNS